MSDTLRKTPRQPQNKKDYIQEVGKYLVENLGKKKFYHPEEVLEASKNSKEFKNNDLKNHSWAMCIFSSHSDFDRYHKNMDGHYGYQKMRKQMLEKMTSSNGSNLADWLIIPEVALDMSWLEFENIFDNVFAGIGDIISGIFDASS